MNKRQKQRVAKLVAALRSGVYTQGTNQLGFRLSGGGIEYNCCLGVACEVAGVEPIVVEDSLFYDGEVSVLSDKLVEYYGFDDPDPELDDGTEVKYGAATWNDREKCSFEEIADMFEYTYLDGPQPGAKNE